MKSLSETLEVLEYWATRVEPSGQTALSAIIGSLFTIEELKGLTVTELADIIEPIETDPTLEAANEEPSPDDDARRARLHSRIRNRIMNTDGDKNQDESEPLEEPGVLASN